MYCMNCGTKNDDQAKFCIKCGQQLTDSVVVNEKPKPAKGKPKSRSMVLISLVLVVAIIVVSIFDLWPWSKKAEKKANGDFTQQGEDQNGVQASSSDGSVTFEKLSLDAILGQCPGCQAAMETYIGMLQASQDWTTSKEEIEALENQKCAQMQHLCTANSIYVEDIPYAFHGSFGLYTGDWIGAGPAGKGTYTGSVYGNNIVTYTGDWGFGLPNGEGQLYLENYLGTWDMTYTGEMKNGMRNGVGSWFEYDDQQGNIHPIPKYRVYDTAFYSNNCLTDKITCVEYEESTGKIIKYFYAITDDNGNPQMLDTWEAGELSPDVADKLYTTIFVAATTYMTGVLVKSVIDSMTSTPEEIEASNQRVMAETNRLRAQAEEEKAKEAERVEKNKERNKDIAWDEMKKLEANGDYGSLDHQKYETISNTGIWY